MAVPAFVKPRQVIGNNLVFRDATPEDAEFIVALRTDETKSRFISKTSTDVSQQVAWLESYAQDNSQVYFIMEDREHNPVGTVRLYDQQGPSFCWGSWVIREGSPSSYAVESALMVYRFALSLGFDRAHFDVRKGNESVWKFHERFGAERTSESELDYFYTLSQAAIEKSLNKYAKFLPDGVQILA
ncbi:MAG: hypothetical protein RI925_1737 [Pseudomonadota bacterium]|jgi:RimJ/RimL family protein N-acetyltransferase